MLLVSCQTTSTDNSVNVQKARQVAAAYNRQQLASPPRTIDDLTQLIERSESRNQFELKALEAAADNEISMVGNADRIATNLKSRADAAGELGRLNQMVKDLEIAKSQNPQDKILMSAVLASLSHAVSEVGNIKSAIRYRQWSLDLLPGGYRVARSNRYATMATYHSQIGDFEAARENLSEAKSYLNSVRSSQAAQKYGPFSEAIVLWATSRVNLDEGLYSNSEAFLLNALQIIDEDIRKNRDSNEKLAIYNLGTARQLVKMNVLETMSRLYLRQYKFAEAEVAARDAVRVAVGRFGGNSVYTAKMISALIPVLARTNRLKEAEKLATTVLKIYRNLEVTRDEITFNKARLYLANVLIEASRWNSALEVFEEIDKFTAYHPVQNRRFYKYNLDRAVALIGTGDYFTAKGIASEVFRNLKDRLGERHYDTAEATGLYAVALLKEGKAARALKIFDQVFPILVQKSRQTEKDEIRFKGGKRFQFIVEGYVDALTETRSASSIAKAFQIINAARIHDVQSAVTSSAARKSVEDPDLKRLVREEQDAQQQISALYGLLSSTLVNGAKSAEELKLRKSISDLRAARATLMEAIEKRFPDYASLVNPKPATIRETQQFLKPDEAIVRIHVGETKTFVWAFQQQGSVEFSKLDLSRSVMSDRVHQLRSALDPKASVLGDIPEYDLDIAHSLYKDLLDPVARGWKNGNHIFTIANNPIAQIPLATLPVSPVKLPKDENLLFASYRSVPWLVNTHSTAVIPSVESFLALRKLPERKDNSLTFAGFGDPWFKPEQASQAAPETVLAARGMTNFRGLPIYRRSAPGGDRTNSYEIDDLPPLPDTNSEILAIAESVKADLKTDVFLGPKASEQNVKSLQLRDRKIIAFATHGLVPGELNGLTQPALALSSPAITREQNDGLLTMDEIMSLKLDADWIILSACNTGAGNGAGTEAISGLGRAFFYAGARSLLVTGWPVETTSARSLTTQLFSTYASGEQKNRARALQKTKIELIENGVMEIDGKSVFSYAHPIFWAPFMVVGNS